MEEEPTQTEENGQPEELDLTGYDEPIPTLPWAMVVQAFVTNWRPLPEGGMMLQITPVFAGPDEKAWVMPPAVQIMMSAFQWAEFKREVERDGRKPPPVEIAQSMPAHITP